MEGKNLSHKENKSNKQISTLIDSIIIYNKIYNLKKN